MTRADLILLVQSRMDEVTPFDANEVVSDTFVTGFLDKAYEESLMKVPLQLITPTEMSVAAQANNPDGTGYIPVPLNYLRLHSFKMTEWKESVTKTITESHPDFKKQKHTTTRGKPNKPVLVDLTYKRGSVSVRALKYFSVVTATTVSHAYYVANPNVDIAGAYTSFTTCPNDLANVIAYQAAGNIFLSQGRADQAQAMYVKVDEWIKLNQ